MRTFNHIKDKHFPEGYPEWIQIAIDKLLDFYLFNVSKRFNLDDIKTVLDIGSLNGIESVKFTEKLKDVRVYNFEPNPESYRNILISTENIDNISCYNMAASNFNGRSKFYITNENMGGSSLLQPAILLKTGVQNEEIEVDCIRIDDWAIKNNIESADILWMDTQGSELNIFLGMPNLLKTVKAIYVECSMIPYYHGAAHKDQVISLLTSYGFDLVSETHHDNYEGDFMFLKRV